MVPLKMSSVGLIIILAGFIPSLAIANETPANFAKCISGALNGPEARFVPLYGQSWHCKPVKFIRVHHPQFKSRALQAMLSRWSSFSAMFSEDLKNKMFNDLYRGLNLSSAPENTHLMIGQLSRHKNNETDDQAYYVYALWRVSADEIVIHGARVTFKAGGVFATPIIGDVLEIIIQSGVTAATGVPFSGEVALKIVKKIEGQDNAGSEANANLIATAIALSTLPVLPAGVSETVSSVMVPLY